jgi:hypothetical protein
VTHIQLDLRCLSNEDITYLVDQCQRVNESIATESNRTKEPTRVPRNVGGRSLLDSSSRTKIFSDVGFKFQGHRQVLRFTADLGCVTWWIRQHEKMRTLDSFDYHSTPVLPVLQVEKCALT